MHRITKGMRLDRFSGGDYGIEREKLIFIFYFFLVATFLEPSRQLPCTSVPRRLTLTFLFFSFLFFSFSLFVFAFPDRHGSN